MPQSQAVKEGATNPGIFSHMGVEAGVYGMKLHASQQDSALRITPRIENRAPSPGTLRQERALRFTSRDRSSCQRHDSLESDPNHRTNSVVALWTYLGSRPTRRDMPLGRLLRNSTFPSYGFPMTGRFIWGQGNIGTVTASNVFMKVL